MTNEITKEHIDKRLESLREQAKAKEADLIAISGAIQDCEFWLLFISQASSSSEPDKA